MKRNAVSLRSSVQKAVERLSKNVIKKHTRKNAHVEKNLVNTVTLLCLWLNERYLYFIILLPLWSLVGHCMRLKISFKKLQKVHIKRYLMQPFILSVSFRTLFEVTNWMSVAVWSH